jgi:hypothetical protein
MARKDFSEIMASEKVIAVHDKPKDRDILKKRSKRKSLDKKEAPASDVNFIKQLKTQLTYGDTGHGIILDRKA